MQLIKKRIVHPRFIEAQGRENRMQLHSTSMPIALFTLYSVLSYRTMTTMKMNPVSQTFCGLIYFYGFLSVCLKGKKRHNIRMGTVKYLILYLHLLTGISNTLCLHITYFRQWSMFLDLIHHPYIPMLAFRDPGADHLNKFSQTVI